MCPTATRAAPACSPAIDGARGPDTDDRRRRRGARADDQRHLSGARWRADRRRRVGGRAARRVRVRRAAGSSVAIDPQLGGDTTREVVGRNAFSFPAPDADQRRAPPVRDRRQLLHPELGDGAGVDRRPRRARARCSTPSRARRATCSTGAARRPSTGDGDARAAAAAVGPGHRRARRPARASRSTAASSRTAPIVGVPAEGELVITYTEQPGEYADGTPYSLRAPTYSIEAPAFGPLGDDLLDLAAARPAGDRHRPARGGAGVDDRRPSPIPTTPTATASRAGPTGSGTRARSRPSSAASDGRPTCRASRPQVAGAFHGDIGITSALHPDQDCTADRRPTCAAAINGGEPELTDERLGGRHLLLADAGGAGDARHRRRTTSQDGAAAFERRSAAPAATPRR